MSLEIYDGATVEFYFPFRILEGGKPTGRLAGLLGTGTLEVREGIAELHPQSPLRFPPYKIPSWVKPPRLDEIPNSSPVALQLSLEATYYLAHAATPQISLPEIDCRDLPASGCHIFDTPEGSTQPTPEDLSADLRMRDHYEERLRAKSR